MNSIKVILDGAHGGDRDGVSGGFGAHVTGDLSVYPGQRLNLVVGCWDEAGSVSGYGNGGNHGTGKNSFGRTGARGGGASAILAINPDETLLAAGGGGGAGGSYHSPLFTDYGGRGGNSGSIAGNGFDGGKGIHGEGSEPAHGGLGGQAPNENGTSGDNSSILYGAGGGGGGGGYPRGGTGGASGGAGGGGGAGSSYISDDFVSNAAISTGGEKQHGRITIRY
ncbi:glycine-rich protein [Streptomyces erythrochromogenes]